MSDIPINVIVKFSFFLMHVNILIFLKLPKIGAYKCPRIFLIFPGQCVRNKNIYVSLLSQKSPKGLQI